ncbi:hypothetical protein [Rudanella lutea]|uniref:hypothetical protein n=1 Tax=Rudanella lutea TaxID=451374 RepID=UPI00037320F7|nr:hypothetical protein [Rudanella lutea]
MSEFQHPLSNAQIELLDLFAHPLSNEALTELKQLLLQFKFDQLEKLANQEWESNNLNAQTIEDRLHGHARTSYRSQQNYLSGKQANP